MQYNIPNSLQFFPSSILHSSNKDYQQPQTSAGLSSDASYKLWQKLHHIDSPVEVALCEHCTVTDIPTKSSTEPELKSKDNSWVGDGAGLECHICTLDGQGTALGADEFDMIPEVSKERSLACEQRCDEEKMAAWGAEAFTQ